MCRTIHKIALITNLTQQLTADNGQTFQYGYDSTSGKYGYYVKEAGTDVFVPFSSGGDIEDLINSVNGLYVSKTIGDACSVGGSTPTSGRYVQRTGNEPAIMGQMAFGTYQGGTTYSWYILFKTAEDAAKITGLTNPQLIDVTLPSGNTCKRMTVYENGGYRLTDGQVRVQVGSTTDAYPNSYRMTLSNFDSGSLGNILYTLADAMFYG